MFHISEPQSPQVLEDSHTPACSFSWAFPIQTYVKHTLAKAIFRGTHFALFRAVLYCQMIKQSHRAKASWPIKLLETAAWWGRLCQSLFPHPRNPQGWIQLSDSWNLSWISEAGKSIWPSSLVPDSHQNDVCSLLSALGGDRPGQISPTALTPAICYGTYRGKVPLCPTGTKSRSLFCSVDSPNCDLWPENQNPS